MTRIKEAVLRVVPRATVVEAAIAAAIVLPIVVIAAYSNSWLGFSGPGELTVFGPAGSAMLHGRWGDVYANNAVQAGPFELFPFGVGWILGPEGSLQWTTYFAVCTFILVFLYLIAILTTTSLSGRKPRVYFAAAIGAAACLSQLLPWAFQAGHPAQVAIPMLWVMAAYFARQRLFVTVGVLVGISAGWEVWGVLGAPVVFCVARPDLVRAALGGLATVSVIYAPFIVSGNFHMFEYKWPVFGGTLAHTLWPAMTDFPWSARVLEGALVLGVGVGVAFATRLTVHGLWLVPVVIVLSKLVLDPLFWGYYSIAPGIVLIAAAGIAFNARSYGVMVLTLVLAAWLSLPSAAWLPAARAPSGAAVILGITAVILPIGFEVRRRRFSPSTA